MAGTAIYVEKCSEQYRSLCEMCKMSKSLENKIHILQGKIPTCRECPRGSRVHYVDVNNFVICNNSIAFPIRFLFSISILAVHVKGRNSCDHRNR